MGNNCTGCGSQNDDGARLCRDCGKAMSGSTLSASRYRPASPGRTVDGGSSVNMTKKILIITAALVLTLGTAIGVGLYFFTQSLSHPSEETAKFLPMETSFYVSMNSRPGAGQLTKGKAILDLFTENPKFEEKLDELYENIEEETGINIKEDLFPWLGPEIAFAVPTFDGIDETPELVAFMGTTDTAAAESFLRKLLAFGEETGEMEYEESVTRGHLTFVVGTSDDFNTHIALTDDYIVIATGVETLESTLDRMDSSQDRPSLFDNAGFQEAREAAESPRFGIMYVDTAGFIDQVGEAFDGDIAEGLEDFGDQLPDFIVASSSFIDNGIRVSTSFDYPTQDQLFVPSSTNSVGSAGLAPVHTVALLSLVDMQDAWERIRDEVSDLQELDLDDALDEIEAEIGIDIDQDIFGWMTGELAFAMLLPGGVSFSTDEIHANVYVEFDDRTKALSSLEKIQSAMEDGGVEFHDFDIEGTDAVTIDLGGEQGLANLTPGYVVLDGYVVIGTTLTSLRQAVEAERGDIPSLRESTAFSRPLAAVGNSTDIMIYGNIRRIVKEILDQLDETELSEYGETSEPFVDPLEAFLLGVAVEEDLVTISAVITFAAPTDSPAPERTDASTPPPMDAQIPEPKLAQAAAPTDAQTLEPAPVQTATPTGMLTREPAAASTSVPTPAVSAPFRVGVMEALTGPGETYGTVAVQAKLMAVDEINAGGGINGRMLELVIEDSRCNARDSIAAYSKLTEVDGVKIILGTSCSGALLGVAPLAEEDGVVLFSGLATNPDIAEVGDYIFRTAMSDDQLGIDTGNVLWADGIRKLATISEASDYAEGVRRTSVAQFEKLGGELVAEERYTSDVTDFRSQLTELLGTDPDAIHIAVQSEFTGGTIVKQVRELGYAGPLYSEVVPTLATALEIAGEAATGLKAITAELDPDNDRAQEVLASFKQQYGYVLLPWYLGSAYDDVYIAAECLKQTGDDQDADGFRDCLYSITWSGALGESYSFDEDGEVVGLANMVVEVLPVAERTEDNKGYKVLSQ